MPFHQVNGQDYTPVFELVKYITIDSIYTSKNFSGFCVRTASHFVRLPAAAKPDIYAMHRQD